MKHQTVSATEFKANCSALLDQIATEGGTITVTKRGKPMATMVRAKRKPFKSCEGILEGKVEIVDDMASLDANYWEVDSNPDRVLNPEKYGGR